MSSFSSVNDTQVVSCNGREADIQTTTQLKFNFSVETSKVVDNVQVLPSWVASAILHAISSDLCDRNKSGCIVSLSIGNVTMPARSCESTVQTSEACYLYSSALQLMHSGDCDPSGVMDIASTSLREAGDLEGLVDYANTNSVLNGTTNVTNVDIFLDETQDKTAAGGNNLTPIFAALGAVVLFVLLIVCVMAARRRSVSNRNKGCVAKTKSANTELRMQEDDSTDSCNGTLQYAEDIGEWVSSNSSRRHDSLGERLKSSSSLRNDEGLGERLKSSSSLRNDDDESNVLKVSSSLVDVHTCASALCPVCRPGAEKPSMKDFHRTASVKARLLRIHDVNTLNHQEEVPPPAHLNRNPQGNVIEETIVSFVRVENPDRSSEQPKEIGAPKLLEL